MGGKEVGGGERRGCEICEGLRKYCEVGQAGCASGEQDAEL